MTMYVIASAVIALSAGAGAALILETTRRRMVGVRLERQLRRAPGPTRPEGAMR